MTSRRAAGALVVVILLAANTFSGVAKVMAFIHQFAAERALVRGDLGAAMARVERAVAWAPEDTAAHLITMKAVQHALANGLPIDGTGSDPGVLLALGVGAAARAIALNPVDSLLWFDLGNLYQNLLSSRERLERMRKAGLAALGESPDGGRDGPVADDRAAMGLRPEDLVTVAAVSKAMELEPNHYFYHDVLAKLHYERGRIEQAERSIRTSMALNPRVEAHPMLFDGGTLQTLASAVLSGIEQSNENWFVDPITAAGARADVLARLGRLEEAIAAYERLRSLGDRLLEAECDLAIGKLHQRLGHFEESIPPLERAAAEGAGSYWGTSALSYLGQAHSRLGDHETALAFLRRYLQEAPEMTDAHTMMAQELEILGRSDEAGRILLAAVRRFPAHAGLYMTLIEHMRRHGESDNALPYAQALRKLHPVGVDVEKLIEDIRREARSP